MNYREQFEEIARAEFTDLGHFGQSGWGEYTCGIIGPFWDGYEVGHKQGVLDGMMTPSQEPAMTTPKSKQINIRLTPQQETLLRQYCVRNGLSTQEAVIAALAKVFAPDEQQAASPGYVLSRGNATKEMLRAGLEKLCFALTVGMPEYSTEDALDMAFDAMLEAAKRNDGGNDD